MQALGCLPGTETTGMQGTAFARPPGSQAPVAPKHIPQDAVFLREDDLVHTILVKYACDTLRVVMQAGRSDDGVTGARPPSAFASDCARTRPAAQRLPMEYPPAYLRHSLGTHGDGGTWLAGAGATPPQTAESRHGFPSPEAALLGTAVGSKRAAWQMYTDISGDPVAEGTASAAASDPEASAYTASSVSVEPAASEASLASPSASLPNQESISQVSALLDALVTAMSHGGVDSPDVAQAVAAIVGTRKDLAPWLTVLAAHLVLQPTSRTPAPIPEHIAPFRELSDRISSLLQQRVAEAVESTLTHSERVRATVNGAFTAHRLASLSAVSLIGLDCCALSNAACDVVADADRRW
jgi:hypothetical protein